MSELHSKLNTEALAFKEEWPYIPHLTIVKMSAERPARTAFQIARERWAHYSGSRRILLERLTFVREDIGGIMLGRSGPRGPRPHAWFRDSRAVITALLLPPVTPAASHMALGTSPSRALKSPRTRL